MSYSNNHVNKTMFNWSDVLYAVGMLMLAKSASARHCDNSNLEDDNRKKSNSEHSSNTANLKVDCDVFIVLFKIP